MEFLSKQLAVEFKECVRRGQRAEEKALENTCTWEWPDDKRL